MRSVKSKLDGNIQVMKNVSVSPFLCMRQRVISEYYIEVKTKDELCESIKYAKSKRIPYMILGGGSNIVFVIAVYKGLVIKNNYVKKVLLKEDTDSVTLLVSSGYPVSRLIAETIEKGYEGFEFFKGMPGTVGGALSMNAKWTRPIHCFSDHLLYANVVDNKGKIKKRKKGYFHFKYDYSIIKETKETILEGIFRLRKENKKELAKQSQEVLKYRLKTQPIGVATCGCFFQNTPVKSAGYLIDKAGLKGYSCGDYIISPKHANFIINKGRGTGKDLLKLVNIVKNRVKEKFGIELKEEIIIYS